VILAAMLRVQQRRFAQIAGIVGSVVTLVLTGILTRFILIRLGP
jgi:hypothetical protein